MQCPLDFPAIGAVVAIASLVGRRVGIYPKRQDDWLVIPNLWGAVIGRPGELKTPALSEVLKPLKRLEIAARERHTEEMRAWEAKCLIRKLTRDEQEKKIKAALRAGEDVQVAAEQLLKKEEDPGPVLRRHLVNDSTIEKLGCILNENPNGTLVFRDELTGWLHTLDKEGHENDRAFYLEAWNGSGSYTYDRIGRGTLFIPAACVSLLGGIQPSRLAEYLRATIHGGGGDDGLIQRFQLAVYPDSQGEWKNVDRWPDSKAKDRAYQLFETLDDFTPARLGIAPNEGELVPAVRFSKEGQGFFNEWRDNLEGKIRNKDLHPALESHLSKYRSLMPSLALLFFLLDFTEGSATGNKVSLRAAQLAAAWCDFLEMHAYRIYGGVTEHALFSARLLADRIQQNTLPNPFTLGAVLRKHWSGLGTLDDVREAADLLEELYWVRAEKGLPGERGGRPRFHYWINPTLSGTKEAS